MNTGLAPARSLLRALHALVPAPEGGGHALCLSPQGNLTIMIDLGSERAQFFALPEEEHFLADPLAIAIDTVVQLRALHVAVAPPPAGSDLGSP